MTNSIPIAKLRWADLTYKEAVRFVATHPFGEYNITKDETCRYPFILRPFIVGGNSNYLTLEEAQAAAQGDFDRKASDCLDWTAIKAPPVVTTSYSEGERV